MESFISNYRLKISKDGDIKLPSKFLTGAFNGAFPKQLFLASNPVLETPDRYEPSHLIGFKTRKQWTSATKEGKSNGYYTYDQSGTVAAPLKINKKGIIRLPPNLLQKLFLSEDDKEVHVIGLGDSFEIASVAVYEWEEAKNLFWLEDLKKQGMNDIMELLNPDHPFVFNRFPVMPPYQAGRLDP